MPNSFTVFPGIIPGNLTVQGKLTVANDQLQLGAAAPFVRVGKDVNQKAVLSYNLGFDNATLDTGADGAQTLALNVQGTAHQINRINPAGTQQTNSARYVILSNTVAAAHSGTTTEDTIYSKTIPGNTLGANGMLRVRVFILAQTQGATPSVYRVRLGGSLGNSVSIAAAGDFVLESEIWNQNAANSQSQLVTLLNVSTGVMSFTINNGVVDTTVNQTLAITVQNGTSTDSQTFNFAIAEQVNSFGPV